MVILWVVFLLLALVLVILDKLLWLVVGMSFLLELIQLVINLNYVLD
jgi:hypothetical protein